MDINWNLYKLFYYVARTGSTAAASKELMISQPSISLGIKQLEGQLKCRLFLRSYKGMELTEQGKTVYEYLKTAVSAIGSAEDYLLDLQVGQKKCVRVATIDTALHFF